METVYRDFAPRGVKFYYIYKSLAHPETNGYVAPLTLEERLMHVRDAREKLGTDISWLCDTIENDVKHALGNAPNSEYIIDPEGNVAIKRVWSDPNQLREDLTELVGAPETVTRVSDLNLPRVTRTTDAPTGVVPRVEVPRGMQALRIEALPEEGDETPYYVKLRAEAESSVFRDGSGQVYLGFFLDPIYEVHWNNLSAPPTYELKIPDGGKADPMTATGPADLEVEADADPREFLINVEMIPADGPIELTLHYVACDDAETFCVPLTQKYLIYLEADRDGGSRRSFGARGPRNGNRGDRNRPVQGSPPRRTLQMILDADANDDGLLTREELPRQMADRILQRFDSNDNGQIDEEELASIRQLLDDQ